MVLSSFGFVIPETELRTLCDCTPYGTDALKAVDAARHLGFVNTAKYTLSFDELQTLVKDERYPIAFIDLGPVDGVEEPHALVVVEVSETSLTVYDPLQGERTLPRQTFSTAWSMMHNLVILIEK